MQRAHSLSSLPATSSSVSSPWWFSSATDSSTRPFTFSPPWAAPLQTGCSLPSRLLPNTSLLRGTEPQPKGGQDAGRASAARNILGKCRTQRVRHSRVFPPPKAPLGVSVSPTVSMQVESLGEVWIFNTFVRYKKPGSLCLFYSMSQPFPWTVLYVLPVPSPSPQTSALWPPFCPSFVGNLCCVSPVPLSFVCRNSGRGFCSPAVLSSSQGCQPSGGSSASPPRSDQLWSPIADGPMTSATFQGSVPEGTVLQRGSQLHAVATKRSGFLHL